MHDISVDDAEKQRHQLIDEAYEGDDRAGV